MILVTKTPDVCVCVCVCVHVTTQSGPVILVILCHSHVCVCACVCVFIKLHITAQSSLVILVILCPSHVCHSMPLALILSRGDQCCLPIYSGRQVCWMYQPGSHRRKVIQDFSSTFLLRCVPQFFSREGFSHSFPSSNVKSNFVYSRFNRSPLFFFRESFKSSRLLN